MNERRFGLIFLTDLETEKIVDYSMKAEKHGFDSVWLAEDYFYKGIFPITTAVALQTETITIGIGCINPFTRTPALIAMETNALDEISNSRLILGIGAGVKLWIEDQMGIPYTKPLTAVKDSIMILRELFKNETATYKGQAISTGSAGIKLTTPAFRMNIPIYIAATGPKAIQLSGEISDGVILSVLCNPNYVKLVKENLAIGAAKTGRSVSDIPVVAYVPTIITEQEDEETKEYMRSIVGQYVAIEPHYLTKPAGITEEKRNELLRLLTSGKNPGDIVTDEEMDKLVVYGTSEKAISKFKDFFQSGVDELVLFMPPKSKKINETLKLLGDVIIPNFKQD